MNSACQMVALHQKLVDPFCHFLSTVSHFFFTLAQPDRLSWLPKNVTSECVFVGNVCVYVTSNRFQEYDVLVQLQP